MDFSPVERQRNGGAPPEAGRGRERSEPENHRGFPAVLRTAPPRHFVPLPHSANRFMGEKSSAPAAGPSNTSPPWSSSGTGEHRRRRGGGASEASQKTTVVCPRSYGPRPLGTSCHSPTPLTASWGRNPLPQRQGRPTPLPRGAAAERGSTAGGGEGARAKRARKPPWVPRGPPDRAPPALRATPPLRYRFVGEKSSAPAAGPSNTSPPWSGSGTGEDRRRRGGGACEASQETAVDSLRSPGPRPLGTSCHSPTPLTASWGRNPRPQRQGRPTPLPRGAAAERGSTAGGGEGARASGAGKPRGFPSVPRAGAPSPLV